MFSWLIHDIAVSDALTMFRCIVLQNAGYRTYISAAVEYFLLCFYVLLKLHPSIFKPYELKNKNINLKSKDAPRGQRLV